MVTNQKTIKIAPDFEHRYPNASARATECAMNLVFTAELLVKRISRLLKPFDLTPASGLVVSILADSETPLSPHEIASRLIVSRATVTGLIDSLERRRYARRISHSTDRRMLLVELTEEGRQVADTFRTIVHQNQKAWLEVLGESDQQFLIDSLHQLQSALFQSDDTHQENDGR